MKIAILDDYQNVTLEMTDWSALSERAEITVFLATTLQIHPLLSRGFCHLTQFA